MNVEAYYAGAGSRRAGPEFRTASLAQSTQGRVAAVMSSNSEEAESLAGAKSQGGDRRLEGDKTLGEMVQDFGVHPTQIRDWKRWRLISKKRAAELLNAKFAAMASGRIRTNLPVRQRRG